MVSGRAALMLQRFAMKLAVIGTSALKWPSEALHEAQPRSHRHEGGEPGTSRQRKTLIVTFAVLSSSAV